MRREVFKYTGILSASMVVAFSSFATNNPPDLNSKVIYGLSNTQHVKEGLNSQLYVQAATFKNIKNANIYKQQLRKKTHQPVTVKARGKYYVVIIGPLNTVAEVKALRGSLRVPLKTRVHELNEPTLVSKHESEINTKVVIGDKDGLEPTALNHIDIIGALGVASLSVNDGGYLGVTSSETDRLVQTNGNNWNTLAAQLGVGYVYYASNYNPFSDKAQWFTAIEPELNGYYLGQSSIKGDVWRFSNPAFNDMTFNMPIESYRLMLDGALTVVTKKQYSLYAIGGIGNAWNRIGYSDADRNGIPCTDQFLNFNSTTRSSFAWELGAGLSYAFNNRFALSLEYLYADLGSVKTPDTGFTGAITAPVLVPASFKLTSQAALLGLHVAI
jgi:opacity protein-like surface antigen